MKIICKWTIISLTLLLIWSCGPTYPDDPANDSYPAPEFSQSLLTYNAAREELHCEVKVLYDLDISEVQADISLEGFENEAYSVALNDSGVLGDAIPYDNIFSRNLVLDRIDSLDGRAAVQFSVHEAGSLLRSYYDTLYIEANLPPLITEIVMPDTLIRPRSGTKDLIIYVHLDDPNGIHDVTNAFFQVQDNDDGSWSPDYSLYDNGESGDEQAGDGIFSTGLQISADNEAATNYFRFRAKDSASNFSDWSIDSVVVR
ncbi:MAG: choice-of-anchor X domain-containing protein [Candidatus Marinimicrobia bacterium]|nr:choice-of-anchor X domain-containing protein [Candidatus Neomarinimicrobiota bacterium]